LLVFNYGEWSFWDAYDPANGIVGGQKVTFDGPNKLILVNYGETVIDVRTDIYSNWKEWSQLYDNSKYLEAITALGGDPITNIQFTGITYFLQNGWRIQPWIGEYVLTVDGNMYTVEIGGAPVNPTDGVSVSLVRSNLVDLYVPETNATISNTDIASIAANVWSQPATSPVANSYGDLVINTGADANSAAIDANNALTTGEYLAFQK
tara:strand:- start:14407 stop:15027 length:621 start_codon:yes stop_codon:yes gene_type:complete